MSWRNLAVWTTDCLAVLTGLVIALPFFLVLVAPFVGGL